MRLGLLFLVFVTMRERKEKFKTLFLSKWPILNVKRPLYTLRTYSRGPKFSVFCSATAVFETQEKTGNTPNANRNDVEHLAVKSSLYIPSSAGLWSVSLYNQLLFLTLKVVKN